MSIPSILIGAIGKSTSKNISFVSAEAQKSGPFLSTLAQSRGKFSLICRVNKTFYTFGGVKSK